MNIFNSCCLEEMKNISDNKIDLLFCDLPWAATSCKWDCAIDLKLFWKEINRICKINCPMFFCCNVKFGNTLINSNPKNFRYDLVWIKSSPVGFLNAKKMPMKKHELIYVFYRKLPFYNLSSHKHKFIKSTDKKEIGGLYCDKIKRVNGLKGQYDPPLPTSIIIKTDLYSNKNIEDKRELYRNKPNQYDPPLPTSIIKDELFIRGKDSNTQNKDIYNYNERLKNGKLYHHSRKLQKGDEPIYDPPLPTSIIKEIDNKYTPKGGNHFKGLSRLGIITNKPIYDPPLPTSIIKTEGKENSVFGKTEHYSIDQNLRHNGGLYDPPLPTSIIKEKQIRNTPKLEEGYGKEYLTNKPNYRLINPNLGANGTDSHIYDPPLPNSILEIKSEKGKHATQKPIKLIEWILKYYSKEGDTILDPTMGSGSSGVACINMNRNYIGIEKDLDIFNVAKERLKIT